MVAASSASILTMKKLCTAYRKLSSSGRAAECVARSTPASQCSELPKQFNNLLPYACHFLSFSRVSNEVSIPVLMNMIFPHLTIQGWHLEDLVPLAFCSLPSQKQHYWLFGFIFTIGIPLPFKKGKRNEFDVYIEETSRLIRAVYV